VRRRRIAATGVLAALAVAVALLASDVRAWPAAIARGDALYALDPASAHWSPQTRLGGLAGTLLGTRGDLAARRGLQLYDQTIVFQRTLADELEVETARAYAMGALAQPAASSSHSVASQARTLQGVLAFDAAGRGGGPSQVEAAIADFTAALELNSANDAAKFDLELLLRLGQVRGATFGPAHAKRFQRTGRKGAAGTAAGHGY
jgi:hypothetical protein